MIASESGQRDVNNSDGIGSRPGLRKHHEDARHRCDPTSKFRSSGNTDGHVAHGLLLVAEASEI